MKCLYLDTHSGKTTDFAFSTILGWFQEVLLHGAIRIHKKLFLVPPCSMDLYKKILENIFFYKNSEYYLINLANENYIKLLAIANSHLYL